MLLQSLARGWSGHPGARWARAAAEQLVHESISRFTSVITYPSNTHHYYDASQTRVTIPTAAAVNAYNCEWLIRCATPEMFILRACFGTLFQTHVDLKLRKGRMYIRIWLEYRLCCELPASASSCRRRRLILKQGAVQKQQNFKSLDYTGLFDRNNTLEWQPDERTIVLPSTA